MVNYTKINAIRWPRLYVLYYISGEYRVFNIILIFDILSKDKRQSIILNCFQSVINPNWLIHILRIKIYIYIPCENKPNEHILEHTESLHNPSTVYGSKTYTIATVVVIITRSLRGSPRSKSRRYNKLPPSFSNIKMLNPPGLHFNRISRDGILPISYDLSSLAPETV